MPTCDGNFILADIKKLLHYYQSIGIDTLPRTDELSAFVTGVLGQQKRSADQSLQKKRSLAASDSVIEELAAVKETLENCSRCSLQADRKSIVFGSGNENADLIIISDWPSSLEDETGETFCGDEGILFDKMLAAIKMDRGSVYCTCLLKCRPVHNVQSDATEVECCLPFLYKQIAAIRPKVICTMGTMTAQILLKSKRSLVSLRGKFHTCRGIPLLPTFHPVFLLKNPEMKKASWIDLQLLQKRLQR